MPKYYFNMSGAMPLKDDEEGTELPSVVAAMEHAVGVTHELGRNVRDPREIIVPDETGAEVFRVPLLNVEP
jgi:hypothetical protein